MRSSWRGLEGRLCKERSKNEGLNLSEHLGKTPMPVVHHHFPQKKNSRQTPMELDNINDVSSRFGQTPNPTA